MSAGELHWPENNLCANGSLLTPLSQSEIEKERTGGTFVGQMNDLCC